MSIPYTYLIGWSKQNRFYYGVRFAEGCCPSELWETYKTSSKYVKLFAEEYGDPDIIKIRKTFNDKNKARLWETKVLTKMNAINDVRFINKTDNISISSECSANFDIENGMYGKKHKKETIQKMKKSKSEIHKKNMRGKRSHVNQTGENNNAFKGWYVTPWGRFDSITEATKLAPFNIPSTSLIGLCKKNTPFKQTNKYNIPVGMNPSDIGYSFIMKEII
jgi:hypothetical protein